MRLLKFNVSGQEIVKAPGCDFTDIVAGTSNYLVAVFDFDKDWADKTKIAAFYSYPDQKEHAVLIRNNVCMIPPEATDCDLFKVGVVGSKDGQRITTNLITVMQERGSGQWRQ